VDSFVVSASNASNARASVRAVGRVLTARPQISPVRAIRAGIERTVNAVAFSRAVSSLGSTGADTVAAGLARTLYALAMLLPRAFCIAST
jgi:hypothetical protein